MGTYCYLQLKRLARSIPGALCVMLVLLGGLLAVFSAAVGAQTEENEPVRIGIVGTADDSLLQMGLAAASTFDSTRFTLELVETTEPEARAALQQGTMGAYLVIPEGFMDEAMSGHILPIDFVTTTGAAGLVTIFKEEVSAVISDVLLCSQQGVYGMQQAMRDHSVGQRGQQMTRLALRYTDYVLSRDQVYAVTDLGIADALGLEGYLLCGLTVLLLHLACLPFAPLMIRQDLSLERVLASRGRSPLAQSLCELLLYMLTVTVLVLLVAVPACLLTDALPGWEALPRLLTVLWAVACFSYMLYALSRDLIGGVLLQFFLSLAMCFVSGCMYPVYFFPVSVQRLAAWLPAGLERQQLAACLTGEKASALPLLCFTVAFAAVGVAARVRAVKEARV